MKRYQRLTRSSDFVRVKNFGVSFTAPLVILITAANGLDVTRVAVAASRAVGHAVERNRAKRQIRACVATIIASIQPGWDLIFYARQPIQYANYPSIQRSVSEVLHSANLIAVEL